MKAFNSINDKELFNVTRTEIDVQNTALKAVKLRFDKGITNLKKQFESVHDLELEGFNTEANDILRSQIVLCEELFDFFVQNCCKCLAFEMYKREGESGYVYKKSMLALNTKDLKTLSTSNNLEEDFYKIIVPKFKFASYMPKGNYDKQFAVVGVSFNDVLKDSFGSVEQGKTFLHNFYNRRNQIAYLLDRPNFKAPQNPIDVDYVNFCIDHISNLSDSIFSSVAALIGNS